MSRVAALFIEALRLDREDPARVRDRALRAAEAGAGGFILFGGDVEGVAELVGAVRRAAGRALWFAADLERGAGQQFRGATELPPPAALAAHPEPEVAVRHAAAWTAREARALGLNWVLAPVLDLDVEARNPIVGTRAFGGDPERVAALGGIWVEACQAEGVAACAKHYPGHGRTTADSHRELPVVDATGEALEADLAPFAAVAETVATVMTAHVSYPALDAAASATFSRPILQDLLRERLGFRGVVVTDAMIMAGFRGEDEAAVEGRADFEGRIAPEGRAAARALVAGCNLLLYPEDLPGAAAALERAADAAPALGTRVEEALERSAAWLARLEPGGDPSRASAAGAAGEARDASGSGAAAAGGSPGDGPVPVVSPARAGQLAAATIRLGGDAAAASRVVASLRADRPARVAVVSDDPPAEVPGLPPEAGGVAAFGAAFREALAGLGWSLVEETRARGEGAAPDDGAQRLVLVAATPRGWKGRAGLSDRALGAVREALAGPGPALPVVFGHPRVLEQVGAPGVCAWSTEPVMQRAAARWLDERVRDSDGTADVEGEDRAPGDGGAPREAGGPGAARP